MKIAVAGQRSALQATFAIAREQRDLEERALPRDHVPIVGVSTSNATFLPLEGKRPSDAPVFRPGKAKREGHSAGCEQTWAGRSWPHRTSSAFPATGCRSRSCWASRRADGIPASKLEKLSDEARKKGVLFFERKAWLNKQDAVAYFRQGGRPLVVLVRHTPPLINNIGYQRRVAPARNHRGSSFDEFY